MCLGRVGFPIGPTFQPALQACLMAKARCLIVFYSILFLEKSGIQSSGWLDCVLKIVGYYWTSLHVSSAYGGKIRGDSEPAGPSIVGLARLDTSS